MYILKIYSDFLSLQCIKNNSIILLKIQQFLIKISMYENNSIILKL